MTKGSPVARKKKKKKTADESTNTPNDSVVFDPEPQPTKPAPDFTAEKSKAGHWLLGEAIEKVAPQREAGYTADFREAGRGIDRGAPGMDR